MRWVSLAVQVLLGVTLLWAAISNVVWAYAFLGETVPVVGELQAWWYAIWPLAYAVLACLALADAIVAGVRGDVRGLARGGLVAKIAAVPFFVVNFAGAVLVAIVALARGGPLVLVVVPAMVAFTYALMLPTSVYGIAALIRLRRDRAIGHGFLWPNLVMHLVFVLDVVSAIVVAVRVRGLARRPAPVAPAVEAAHVRPHAPGV